MEPNDRLKRKLAAILHADIVDLGRLSNEANARSKPTVGE